MAPARARFRKGGRRRRFHAQSAWLGPAMRGACRLPVQKFALLRPRNAENMRKNVEKMRKYVEKMLRNRAFSMDYAEIGGKKLRTRRSLHAVYASVACLALPPDFVAMELARPRVVLPKTRMIPLAFGNGKELSVFLVRGTVTLALITATIRAMRRRLSPRLEGARRTPSFMRRIRGGKRIDDAESVVAAPTVTPRRLRPLLRPAAHPQDDDRQGARRFEGGRGRGDPHLARPREGKRR